MIGNIITGIVTYVSTSIDDLLVSAIFFAQSNSKRDNIRIITGKYLGTGLLVAIGCLGAFGLKFIPTQYIGLIGFIPIVLGIKEFLNTKKIDDSDKQTNKAKGLLFHVAVVSIANGADNIGVYIPLFAGYKRQELLLICVVYAVMIAIWCYLAKMLTSLPRLRNFIAQHKPILIPAVYVVLGCYILVKSYLF